MEFSFDFNVSSDSDIDSDSSGGKVPSIMKTVSLICALLVPITYATVNTIDKVIVSSRVNHTNSYVIFAGIVDACIGLVIGCFGDWSRSTLAHLSWKDYVFPLFSGMSLGLSTVMYFYAMEWADPSKVVGIMAIYPLFVILWSLIFLKDTINPAACIGIAITIFGGFLLSVEGLKQFYRFILAHINSCSDRSKRFNELEDEKKRQAAEAEEAKRVNKGYGECWYPCKKYNDSNNNNNSNSNSDIVNEEDAADTDPLLTQESRIGINYNPSDEQNNNNNGLIIPTESSGSIAKIEDIEKAESAKKTETNDNNNNNDNNDNNETHKKSDWKRIVFGLLPMPIFMSGNDFFAKLSVGDINTNNVSALNSIGLGFVLACMALKKEARTHFVDEVKYNWLYCIIVETLTVLANYLLITGMVGLPAYIVSSLSAARPLFILILETVLGISRDSAKQCFGFKLFPIVCTVSGVVLMTLYS